MRIIYQTRSCPAQRIGKGDVQIIRIFAKPAVKFGSNTASGRENQFAVKKILRTDGLLKCQRIVGTHHRTPGLGFFEPDKAHFRKIDRFQHDAKIDQSPLQLVTGGIGC